MLTSLAYSSWPVMGDMGTDRVCRWVLLALRVRVESELDFDKEVNEKL